MKTLAIFWAALAAQTPQEEPEEWEQLRTRTAFLLPPERVDVDQLGSFLRFDDLDEFALVTDVNYGLNDWLTAELEVPILAIDPEDGSSHSGIGDIDLELKGSLPVEGFPLVFAAGARTSLPTGDEDEGLGRGEFGVGGFVAASRRFDWFSTHLDAGVTAAQNFRPLYRINGALDLRPWEDWMSFLLAVNAAFEGVSESAFSAVPGFAMRLLEPRIQVGASMPVGLDNDAEDWGFIVDAQARF
ncbi:MAG: hypothetical protein HYY16_08845 [Planctomycetes bacterium]|nr:hypothetical protein [Planctomycetota bacterium]